MIIRINKGNGSTIISVRVCGIYLCADDDSCPGVDRLPGYKLMAWSFYFIIASEDAEQSCHRALLRLSNFPCSQSYLV